jgi:hypothetical protein
MLKRQSMVEDPSCSEVQFATSTIHASCRESAVMLCRFSSGLALENTVNKSGNNAMIFLLIFKSND